jgi:FkbM family methyltransferase
MSEIRTWVKNNLRPAVPPLKRIAKLVSPNRSAKGKNEHILKLNKAEGLKNSQVVTFAPETYAQSGEDIILSGLLSARMRAQKRSMKSVFYIEIGANQPIATSNSYLLYRKFGAHGVLVEANPDLIPDLERVRPRDKVVQLAISTTREPSLTLHVGNAHELSSLNPDHVRSFGEFGGAGGIARVTVRNMHINDFLASYAQETFDMLSIDCEGIDYDLLIEADFDKFKPFIVQCEPSEHFIPANGARMISLMESRSYYLTAVTDVNLIFTRKGEC